MYRDSGGRWRPFPGNRWAGNRRWTSSSSTWYCRKCGRHLYSKDAWLDHKREHANPPGAPIQNSGRKPRAKREIPCDRCPRRFRTPSALQAHQAVKHPQDANLPEEGPGVVPVVREVPRPAVSSEPSEPRRPPRVSSPRPRAVAAAPAVEEPASDCFIATAAYGSPFEARIQVLRDWRDRTLLRSVMGRLTVRAYYVTSPPLARMVRGSALLRRIVRAVLDPLVRGLSRRGRGPA